MADASKDQEKDEDKETSGSDLEAILDELGGPTEVRISVYRAQARGGQPAFLETIGAPLDRDVSQAIRDRFGGGQYQLQFRLVDEGGIKRQRHLTIAGPPKPHPEEEPEEDQEGEETRARAQEEESEVQRLRRKLEEKTEELREAKTMDLISGLAREVASLKEELRNPPREAEGQNPAELALSILGAVQAQTQPYLQALLERKEPEPTAETMMDAFFRGLEAANQLQSGNEYAGVIREVGKPLVGLLGQAIEQGRVPTMGGADPTMARPNPPDVAPNPEPWQRMIAPYVPHLMKWAQLGSDPEMRARLVLEEIPDAQLDQLAEAVYQDGFLEEFLAAVPAAQPHRPWFSMFYGELRDGMDDIYTREEDAQEEGPGVEVGTGAPPDETD